MTAKVFFALFRFCSIRTRTHQQPRRRLSGPDAQNVAPSENLAKLVVAAAEVPGTEIVEVMVTQKLSTHGTAASRPAKHGSSLTQPPATG